MLTFNKDISRYRRPVKEFKLPYVEKYIYQKSTSGIIYIYIYISFSILLEFILVLFKF